MADAATQAEIAMWVAQLAAVTERLQTSAANNAASAWKSFQGWYDTAAVTALAAEMADLSIAAQQTTAGVSAQFATEVAAATLGAQAPRIPGNLWEAVRNGAPMRLVHSRPAEVFKRAVATGATHEQAVNRAVSRATGLIVSDLTLEDRAVQRSVFERMGVEAYRRVIHPEMSRTGTCGLCIVAADRIYSTNELMPLHPPSCNCTVLPIVGEFDPGLTLNREDLDALYAAAGSNKAVDLRRTGYKSLEDLRKDPYAVHEHGELGPMLSRANDKFRGPTRVPLEHDPQRAARMLAKTEPVLAGLLERDAAGDDVSDPLSYQQELVARLRDIVAA